MDSKNIFDYILKLENYNEELKINNIQLKNIVNDLNEELNNFKKVSIMINFNKQLKEKENTIIILENEIKNIKKKNNFTYKLQESNNHIIETDKHMIETDKHMIETDKHMIETDKQTEKITELFVKDTSSKKTKNKKQVITNVDETQLLENKKNKKQINCEIIKYKSNEYLLNNDSNEIFNIDDKKLFNSIGILTNGKVKFYKR
jgi:hypothetical protein